MQHQCNGDEEWRSVSGWEGIYEVSCFGRLRRLVPRSDWTGTDRPPRNFVKITAGSAGGGHGYPAACLSFGTRKSYRLLHALVAEAFLGPRPSKHTVNHLDGNRTNNHAENLEWATYARNNEHAREVLGVKYGVRGEAHYGARLTAEQVAYIRNNPKCVSYSALARQFGVGLTTIHWVVTRKTWAWTDWKPCDSSCGCSCHFPSP